MYLTPREQQTLEAIRKLSKTGFPPSQDEVKEAIGLRSSRMTQELIKSLRNKGLLRTWPGRRQRAIVLAPMAMNEAA